MLRRPAPPAPRRRPVQADVRAGVKAVAGRSAAAAWIGVALPLFFLAAAAPPEASAAASDAALRALVGQILYVHNPTTVRTRGGGNLSVDLPRGQAVVLIELHGDRAILAPGPADAGLLRAYGVRRPPRYTTSPAQLTADFLPAPAWAKAREEGARPIREHWPALTADHVLKIFLGEPFVGLTEEQADEAVGRAVLVREPIAGEDGAVTWTIGRRPRAAELRVYTEARERGARARTFEEFLSTRTRAVLTFRGGVLVSIDTPEGQTPGLNWP